MSLLERVEDLATELFGRGVAIEIDSGFSQRAPDAWATVWDRGGRVILRASVARSEGRPELVRALLAKLRAHAHAMNNAPPIKRRRAIMDASQSALAR